MINVTKTYLPPFEEYTAMLKRAWDLEWITNNGMLVQELEANLKNYLKVKHLWFAANGTIVLQMALKALDITKEVITTPFSYVATANSILWEGCTPVFVDINPVDLCIDASLIERSITENTQAILATHVYGFPCDVEKIEEIAKKYNLKVIYDGAHAFGCTYKGKSLLSFGDISTCSFHATKIFHTVEGGCIICNDKDLAERLYLYRSFGHKGDDYFSLGINAKNSEMHAAMGLCVLPKLEDIIESRKTLFNEYDRLLNFKNITRPESDADFVYNYAYYPVILRSEKILLRVRDALLRGGVSTRRYFYPALNKLPFLNDSRDCPNAEDISSRILCLPLYHNLEISDIKRITSILNDNS